jgi:hypothetical protein
VWGVLNTVSRDQMQDGPIWRQVQFLSVIGPAALPPELLDRVSSLFIASVVPITFRKMVLFHFSDSRVS